MLNDSNAKATSILKSFLTAFLVVLCLASMTLGVSASEDDTDINSNQVGTVTVNVDGTSTPVVLKGSTTVEEILNDLEITLGETDEINIPLSNHVYKDDVVTITRRGYSNKTVEGEIPFKTVYYYSEGVKPGEEVVLVEGKNGYGIETYRQYVVDGVVKEETLIESEYSVEPITKEIGTGFYTPPVSNLDFDWEFNSNREPVAVKVLRGQRSTAYTAKPGAKTASGRDAIVGHVAVNPNVIPYGSKLFIQSSDGKLVYGYAIAADTGGALLSGAADVDLFFNTHGECVKHGVKNVDIFVLETPQ